MLPSRRKVLSVASSLIDQRHDDFPVARGVDLADEREIAVENAFVDHRIARHFERIMFARTKQRGGDREAFRALQRLDRRAGGNLAVKRNFDRVVGRRPATAARTATDRWHRRATACPAA